MALFMRVGVRMERVTRPVDRAEFFPRGPRERAVRGTGSTWAHRNAGPAPAPKKAAQSAAFPDT